MPCYKPLQAFKTAGGEVVFQELRRYNITHTLALPCGQCIGCRLERSRQWAVRCVHEASLYENNCFVTLTYATEWLDPNGSLQHRDFQLFMKRLRKRYPQQKIRYYMCGEYGEQNQRPHFHACLFNFDFEDKIAFKRTIEGNTLWESTALKQLWPYGHASLGEVNFQTAAYVARYVMKKINGQQAKKHYEKTDSETGEITNRKPEYTKMSLKPGIANAWLKKWTQDVYPHGKVIINGKEANPPKYYDKLFKKMDPDAMELLAEQRDQEGRRRYQDNTPERLATKETVAQARLAQLKRKL